MLHWNLLGLLFGTFCQLVLKKYSMTNQDFWPLNPDQVLVWILVNKPIKGRAKRVTTELKLSSWNVYCVVYGDCSIDLFTLFLSHVKPRITQPFEYSQIIAAKFPTPHPPKKNTCPHPYQKWFCHQCQRPDQCIYYALT